VSVEAAAPPPAVAGPSAEEKPKCPDRERPWRIGFVNTHPIQYFAPLYAYLNATRQFEITAFYLSDYSVRGAPDRAFGQVVKWDIDLLSGYDAQFIAGAERRNEPAGFLSMIAPQVWRTMRDKRLDALVIHGHTPAATLIAAASAAAVGTPVFARGETHLGLPRGRLKRRVRQTVMRHFYQRLAGVLAIGSANAAFYRALGVPSERIFSVPYTVDNDRFTRQAAVTEAERRQIRASVGVRDDRPIVLYAAKLQRRKRPHDLLQAAAILSGQGIGHHLVVAGSGEMEGELRALAQALRLSNIHFQGFVNQAALPQLYASADVFVLPSEAEPWGLAVNEAMCAGLPVVTSSAVGCAPDLVRPGVNGATFQARDVAGLVEALRPILIDPDLRARMSAASRAIMVHWSFAECAAGLAAAMTAQASAGRFGSAAR